MKHLNATATFLKVAQLGSFTKAAESLDMAKSSVSRTIAQLERELGVTLLYRNARRFRLTEEGERFRQHCEVIANEYECAIADISQRAEQVKGTVRVNIPSAIGQLMIAPALPDFLQQHPEVSIQLDLSHTTISMLEDWVDMAVIFGNLPDSGMVAQLLAEIPIRLYASQSYLDAAGVPEQPEDLSNHQLLLMSVPNLRRNSQWIFTDSEAQVHSLSVQGSVTMNDALALKGMMLNGGGIVALPPYLVAKELKSGKVAEVLKGFYLPQVPLYAVFHDRKHTPPKVRQFLTFIRQQLDNHLDDHRH